MGLPGGPRARAAASLSLRSQVEIASWVTSCPASSSRPSLTTSSRSPPHPRPRDHIEDALFYPKSFPVQQLHNPK